MLKEGRLYYRGCVVLWIQTRSQSLSRLQSREFSGGAGHDWRLKAACKSQEAPADKASNELSFRIYFSFIRYQHQHLILPYFDKYSDRVPPRSIST